MKTNIRTHVKKLLFFFRILKDPDLFLKNVSGVIHIGANTGQEVDEYGQYALAVIWVEPIPEVFRALKKNIIKYPKQKAFKYLLLDSDDKDIEFKIANNNGQSSSIFDFGQHTKIWPDIYYTKTIHLKSSTLTNLVKREKIDIKKYQALVLDTQGSELLILKGASELLKNFRYIKTEAPDFESYLGCCLIQDISNFLIGFGFNEIIRSKQAGRKGVGTYYDVVYERTI